MDARFQTAPGAAQAEGPSLPAAKGPGGTQPLVPEIIEALSNANDEIRSLVGQTASFNNSVLGIVPPTPMPASETGREAGCSADLIRGLLAEQRRLIRDLRAEVLRLGGIY